jgi:hypothetical protein
LPCQSGLFGTSFALANVKLHVPYGASIKRRLKKEQNMRGLKVMNWAAGMQLCSTVTALASGEKLSEIVVVADTRVLNNPIMRYIADTYNTNLWLFAVWSVVLTALFGAFLGLLMDWLINKTGLDLNSRKIIEH